MDGNVNSNLGQRMIRIDITPETGASPAPEGAALRDVRKILHSLPDGGLVIDRTGRILDVNAHTLHFFLYEPEQLRAHNIFDILGAFDSSLLETVWQYLQSEKRVLLDVICLRKDKSTLPAEIEVVCGQWSPEQTECFLLIARDRIQRPASEEEQKVAESRLARAERLEMAGTVAGQIAHDFNNLLTPLIAYPQLIRKELPSNSAARNYLDLMEKTACDMSHLTQQLLSLSRRGHISQEFFSIHDVIDQVLSLMKPALPPNIRIVVEKADHLLDVRGSKEQMVRVIQNLCQNAIDAMGEAGSLRIRTENVYLDAPFGQYESVNIGEYVKITITDTGSGILDAIKDKIFDPFFTTKKASKQRGSGLGLSIVHGIVKDHGGYIDLESTPGKGTSFYLYIPPHREEAVMRPAPKPSAHGETVLVVDDDPLQVTVLLGFLKTLGYQAVGRQTGEDALALIRDQHMRFDLVILDIIFNSGMDGLDTFIAVRKLIPNQRTILMSGFDHATKKVEQAQRLGAGMYLKKPITLQKVAEALQKEFHPEQELKPLPVTTTSRIMIADDDKLIRKLFMMVISNEYPHAVIDQASDGTEAVHMFQSKPYDLIVMDLQMPKMTGSEAFLEIAHYCRETGRKEPRVIFCTGFAPPESLANIIGDGTRHSIIRKPVHVETLLKTIRESL